MKKIVYLDFDDFSEQNNRLDWLWMLKNEFPNFKVNVFAIPSLCSWAFVKYIKYLGFVNLCVHGQDHKHNEEICKFNLRSIIKAGYSKIYRAPYWQLSDKMYNRLKKLGFKIMIHPDDKRDGIKYNWNIKDSPPFLNTLYGHGHIQDYPLGPKGNGLIQAFDNILKLPKNTDFRFL